MSEPMLRVAFVGCGRIADLHYLGYKDNPSARLVAICDTNPEILSQRKLEWSVEKTYTSYADLLKDPDIDAVEILTPQKLHESMTIAALESGKHVALQKPMTIDLASSNRMARAVSASTKVFKVTENYVFYPPIRKARELIAEGRIGEPLNITINYVSGPDGGWEVPADAWTWRVEEAREGRGFATFDHGHHLWSTAWFLLGEPHKVTGWIDSHDGLVDCPAVFSWKYKEAHRFGSCTFVHGDKLRVPSKYYSNDEWITIWGSAGIIEITRCTGNIRQGPGIRLFDGHTWTEFEVDTDWSLGFVGATNDFIGACLNGTRPMLTFDEARTVLRFSLALQRSVQCGAQVYVESLDARWPRWYSWRQQRKERSQRKSGDKLWTRVFGSGTGAFADRALELTERLLADYVPPSPPLPYTSIGLVLSGDNRPEMRLSLVIRDNKPELTVGSLPEDARLTVTMSPGLWAAILLKKRRIEFAVMQGKVKFTGKVDEALKLKDAFKF